MSWRVTEAPLDWKIFETAGKYAGLGGIAVIVLLYLFRLILKLPIFDKIGGKGTLQVINNIINKVFWVTIVALLCWLAVALFGKAAQPSSQQSSEASGITATIPAQDVEVTDLPQDLLVAVNAKSHEDLIQQLKERSSLTLNGSTLTIGAPGTGKTVTIACNTLRLTSGARIITNGNHLVLQVANFSAGDNRGIISFLPQTLKAAPTADGLGGGKVRIDALESFSGSLKISLPGQNGGDGVQGGKGGPGRQGDRGANSVQGFPGCASGGQDGKPGGQGAKGAPGGTGGVGGDGGELILEDVAATNKSLIDFEKPGGTGGLAGAGGPGGDGGPGGEGGSGGGSCGGGHGGASGPAGPVGDPGAAGANGHPGKLTP